MRERLFSNVVSSFQGGFSFGAERALLRRRLQQEGVANAIISEGAEQGLSFSEIQSTLLATPGVSNEIKFRAIDNLQAAEVRREDQQFRLTELGIRTAAQASRDASNNQFRGDQAALDRGFRSDEAAADRTFRAGQSSLNRQNSVDVANARNTRSSSGLTALMSALEGAPGLSDLVEQNQQTIGATDAVTGAPAAAAAPISQFISPLDQLRTGAREEAQLLQTQQEQVQEFERQNAVISAEQRIIDTAVRNVGENASQVDLLNEVGAIRRQQRISESLSNISF